MQNRFLLLSIFFTFLFNASAQEYTRKTINFSHEPSGNGYVFSNIEFDVWYSKIAGSDGHDVTLNVLCKSQGNIGYKYNGKIYSKTDTPVNKLPNEFKPRTIYITLKFPNNKSWSTSLLTDVHLKEYRTASEYNLNSLEGLTHTIKTSPTNGHIERLFGTSASSKSNNKKKKGSDNDTDDEDDNNDDSEDDYSDDDEINREASRARAEALKKTNYYNYVYSGIDKDDAYRMMQDDLQREQDYKKMKSSLNTLGTSVVSYFQNRAKSKEAARVKKGMEEMAFKNALNEKIDNFSQINLKFRNDLMDNIDERYPLTKNIEELKQRILAIIYGHHNVYRPRTFKGNHRSWREREKIRGYVQQKINKAWFKGNVLHMDVSEEVIETEADVTYAPYKYIADTHISYDFNTDTSEIKRRIIWSNQTALPKNEWLSNNYFDNRVEKINDSKYIAPPTFYFSKYFQIGPSVNSTLSTTRSALLNLLQANKREEQLAKPDFVSEYNKTLKEDLYYLDGIIYGALPYVFLDNELKSSNPKETSVLYLLKDNKYIVYSFPEQEKSDLFLNPSFWHNKQEDFDKHAEYYTVRNQKFRLMNNDNEYIGGESGEDLLLSNNRSGGKKRALLLNYKDGLLAKEVFYATDKFKQSYSKRFIQSNWNPKVEIGTYTIWYDNNVAIDKKNLDVLNEIGAKASYSSSHLGLKVELVSDRTGYLSPIKINTYSAKNKKIDNGLYQYRVSNTNFFGNAINIYSFSRRKNEVPLRNLIPYKELGELNLNPHFSQMLMNGYHKQVKSFDTGKPKTTTVSNNTTINALLDVIKELGEFNYDLSTIKDSGRIKYINENGVLRALGLMILGKKYGEWVIYHKGKNKGKVHIKANYRYGDLHGKYNEYDEKGRLTLSEIYNFGMMESGIMYHYQGDTHWEQTYDSEKRVIKAKLYIKDVFSRLEVYSYDDNNAEHIDLTDYHSNGNIKTKGSKLNGDLHGLYKAYYEDGSLFMEGVYNKGISIGIWKTYSSKGKLLESKNLDKN